MDSSSKEHVDALKGDEVVISGMSGVFPKSDSTTNFMENLFNKVDMVSSNNPRWTSNHPEMPKQLGLVNGMEKFDTQFFKVHTKLAHAMEPMARKLLEHTYGAIYDAGLNPAELKRKRIGVFLTCGPNEYEKFLYNSSSYHDGFALPGNFKAMFPNRINYWIDTKSPSFVLETGSFMACLDYAYRTINSGDIEAAIIGSTNYCTQPGLSLNLSRAGVLCLDGKTKCFDQNGDGYVRADSVNMFFLQKAKDARRIYSEVYHSKNMYHTGTEKYSPLRETKFIQEFLDGFYSEIYMDPSHVEYVEGSAAGIAESDGNELKAVSEVFSKEAPIKIGSVKSNMGCAETASGGCAITKVCLAYHKGEVPANLHYYQPQDHIPAVRDGRVQVLTEHMPFKRGFIACNSFNEFGSNSHVLFKGHYKPKDLSRYKSNIPHLVFASGRLESCVHNIFDNLKKQPVDPELIGLLHSIHSKDILGHIQRGFIILDGDKTKTRCLRESISNILGEKPQLWFIYTGMGSQWAGMGAEFMHIPTFAAAIQKCQNVLLPKGVDIIKIITDPDKNKINNRLNSFVGITAMQIALTDLLKELGIEPDHILGHSLGELACAYADGCFTAEQTILISYIRGKIALDLKSIKGSMVAVGLGYKDILPLCPPEVDVACHNSPTSCTLSGPADILTKFTAQLTKSGIFAKEVPCGDIAYHSRYIHSAEPVLISAVKNFITEPKLRSPKWVSSCLPQKMWNEPLAKYSSAEYHCYNLMNPVLFEESAKLIPPNSVLVEVSPHGLFQSILKQSHKDCIYVPLARRLADPKELEFITLFLSAIGRLYELGFNPKIEMLYPKVQYPVSTETPLLSHFVEWNHTEDWPVPIFDVKNTTTSRARDQIISIYDDDYKYLEGYVRNGMNVIPEAAFLVFAWETLAMYKEKKQSEMSIVLDDIHFHNEVLIKHEDIQNLNIMIMKNSGAFEITYNNMLIVTGTITEKIDIVFSCDMNNLKSDKEILLNKKDVYKCMDLKGYSYSKDFQTIYELNMQNNEANIKWNGEWVTLIDSLIQINILLRNYDGVSTPKYITKLTIDVENHKSGNAVVVDDKPCIKAQISEIHGITRCGGIELMNILFDDKPCLKEEPDVIEACTFIPHILNGHINFETALYINLQIIKDNVIKEQIQITELFLDSTLSISNTVCMVADIFPVNNFNVFPINIQSTSIEFVNNFGKTDVIIVHDLLRDQNKTNDLYSLLSDDTFILAIEADTSEIYPLNYNLFTIISAMSASEHTIILLKKATFKEIENVTYINVTHDDTFSWIPNILKELESDKKVILVSRNQPLCGLFGFVKSLRQEYGKQINLFVVDDDKAPEFNVEKNVYKRQLDKNLTFNILEKGRWGSYYYIPRDKLLSSQSFRLIRTGPGNFDSLKWAEAPTISANKIVKVSYASLSYRDAEKAIGDINDADENVFGMDFSGINAKGERVMGIISEGAVSSVVEADPDLIWPVPEHWNLEDAATVPLPYLQAYYCLAMKGKLKRRSKVLVTGGAGALGQAIISICLDFDCTVFTTVSDLRKKKFLLRLFPDLNENYIISDSRCETIYETVRLNTNKSGCNLIINCASGAMRATVFKCIFKFGTILDLSTFSRDGKSNLLMDTFADYTYCTVDISSLFKYNILKDKKELQRLVSEGIAKGLIKPLSRVVYSNEHVPRAFRLLASRKHIGRVLIDMNNAVSQVIPRLTISPEVTYIVVGGRNELGTELIDRLVKRGVRKLVIQYDKVDGYFNMKLTNWQKLGVNIKLTSENLQTKEGCDNLLKEGNKLKHIEGVFIVGNGEKLFNDKINQESMRIGFQELTLVVSNLDLMTRAICDNLRYFVVLTNSSHNHLEYEYAITASENICRARTQVGLPTLFFCADIFNKSHQTQNTKTNIRTCLNALETSIKLKYNNVHTYNLKKRNAINIPEKIAKILGIPDITVAPDNLRLRDLNVSRVTIQEIIAVIKNTCQISQSEKYVKELSIADIKQLMINDVQQTNFNSGLSTFFNRIENYGSKAEPVISMSTRLANAVEVEDIDSRGTYLMLLPGFDGNHLIFTNLCKDLKIDAVTLQLDPDMPNNSTQEMAKSIVKFIKKRFEIKSKFYLLGYSFGVNIALQVAALLELEGHTGVIFCLDSSPDALRIQLDANIGKLSTTKLENAVLQHMYQLMTGRENVELKGDLDIIEDWNEKVRITIKRLKSEINYPHEYIQSILETAYRRILLAREYVPDFKLESQLVLLKGISHPEAGILADDYNLSKYTKQSVKVYDIQSDHMTAPQDRRVANYINMSLDSKLLEEFKKKNLCDKYFYQSIHWY